MLCMRILLFITVTPGSEMVCKKGNVQAHWDPVIIDDFVMKFSWNNHNDLYNDLYNDDEAYCYFKIPTL